MTAETSMRLCPQVTRVLSWTAGCAACPQRDPRAAGDPEAVPAAGGRAAPRGHRPGGHMTAETSMRLCPQVTRVLS